jgi:hypothetical protein
LILHSLQGSKLWVFGQGFAREREQLAAAIEKIADELDASHRGAFARAK